MRGLYIHSNDLTGPLSGIDRKVAAQIKCFNEAGFECSVVKCAAQDKLWHKVMRRLPLMPDYLDWSQIGSQIPVDFLYIRRPLYVSRQILLELSRIKQSNPLTKVLWEVPTYPYDKELKKPATYAFYLKDRHNRKKLKRYVDRVVDLSGSTNIFGVPTLQIINGVDLSAILPKDPAPSCSTVNVICIAAFSFWHGTDRFIDGMRAYYNESPSRALHLHLVGNGPAIPSLREQVVSSNLEAYVHFHGFCDRQEMDHIFNQCTFALEGLAGHRQGIMSSSSLKSREYLAKGIPFATSSKIDVFREHPVDFCLQLAGNDSPINIHKLIEFHDVLYEKETQSQLISRIRSFAEANVSIEGAMKNVIGYLKESKANEL